MSLSECKLGVSLASLVLVQSGALFEAGAMSYKGISSSVRNQSGSFLLQERAEVSLSRALGSVFLVKGSGGLLLPTLVGPILSVMVNLED